MSGDSTSLRLAADERADLAVVALLVELARTMEVELPGAVAGDDPECLHRYRVALRRTRSLLRESKGVLPPKATARFRADFKSLQQVTGPVRDLDVLLADLKDRAGALPPPAAADLDPVRDLLRRRRRRAVRKMRSTVRSREHARLWQDWLEVLNAVPQLTDEVGRPRAARPVGSLARERIAHVYARMVEEGEAIDDRSPGSSLHELRKRGKELRYLLELFGPLLPSSAAKPVVRALKDLQDVLGRFQDMEVQASELQGLAARLARLDRGAAALMALGAVVHGMHADQLAARAHFAKRFQRLASTETRARVEEIAG